MSALTKEQILEDIQHILDPNIKGFRENQYEIIDAIVNHQKSVIGVMPTGSGKSLCFQYPALQLKGLTIVITPLISLMDDQASNFNGKISKIRHKHNIKGTEKIACTYHTGQSSAEKRRVIQLCKGVVEHTQCKLLYISPEAFMSEKFLMHARSMNISMIVLDEAHCFSLWGYDFRPNYIRIADALKILNIKPIIAAFSATLSKKCIIDLKTKMYHNDPIVYYPNSYEKENLTIFIKRIDKNTKVTKFRYLVKEIEHYPNAKGIIYCETIAEVEKLYYQLTKKYKNNDLYRFSIYHGKQNYEDKTKSYHLFKTNACNIMIATNAFGMGIDIDDIRYIVHYGAVTDLESFFQQIGRAGRDGKPAHSLMVYNDEDIKVIKKLINTRAVAIEDKRLRTDIKENGKEKLNDFLNFIERVIVHKNNRSYTNSILNDYFKNNEIPQSDINKISKSKEKKAQINRLYTNETKLVQEIRKQKYEPNLFKTVINNKDNTDIVEYQLSDIVDYVDLMILDAIYTCYSHGYKKIFIQNIMEVLSQEKIHFKKDDKRREELESRIDHLANVHVEIKRTRIFNEQSNITNYSGVMLDIRKEGKAYRLEKLPILYQYAEDLNLEFFTIEKEYFDSAIPKKVLNLAIAHYLARRIYLIKRTLNNREGNSKNQNIISNEIAIDTKHTNLYKILNLEESDEIKKRVTQIIQILLKEYDDKQIIYGYQIQYSGNGQKRYIKKITVNLYPNSKIIFES